LEQRIGEDWLGGFIKVMELTLLLEAWLNKDEFCEEDLCLFDKFVPYFIHTFTMVVNRTEGHGMKLIKVHLLHHFTTMIQLFGCAKNVDTFIPKITSQKSKNMQDKLVINQSILNTELPTRIMKMSFYIKLQVK